jgi:uncharacterized protein (DUF302 family)
MFNQLQSKKTLDEIDRDLQNSAARNHFGIIGVHDLQQAMRRKDMDLPWSAGFTRCAIRGR